MHGMNRRGRSRWAEHAQFDGDDAAGIGRGGFGRGRHGGSHRGGRGHGGRGHGAGFRGEDAWGEGPGPFGGGGRRRGKRFQGEELRLMVLALLEDEPRHGYELIRAFAERSGDAYSPSPGVLYPLLTMLQDMELIAPVPGESSSRRSFALTEAGRAELETGREAVEALFARLAGMAEATARTDAAPVRRAMMNLRTATMQRLGREAAGQGDAPGTLAFDIAAILDEAAQKIERLA